MSPPSSAGRRLRAGSGVAALVTLSLLSASCQPSPMTGSGASRSPSPSPSVQSGLAAADARFFTGDYEGAEGAYRVLVGKGVVGAQSHLAILLAYESRFREAVAEAGSAAIAHPDSGTLARLTRALDWAVDLPGALQAGKMAVATKPVEPIAHVFYSEALADSGRYDEAQRELRAAGNGGDAYTRAEADREWSNYYRDRGDFQRELDYIQRALQVQPRFPERKLEMARYDYSRNKNADARTLLQSLSKGQRSPAVLTVAGDAALLGGDNDFASATYDAALAVQPDAVNATLGRSQVDVAVKRDFQAAHDRLLGALKKSPGSPDLYLYLRYVDLLLLKRNPDDELKAVAPQPPPELGAARHAAVDRVNAYRASVGVPPVTEDAGLAEGAEAHSYYFLFNFGQKQVAGLGIHSEDPALPGFTGADGLARGRHFGYGGTRGAEVINHVFKPEAAVQVWVDSVYHRFPALDRDSKVAGYGQAQVGGLSIQVIDFGLASPTAGDAIVYPYPGQQDVPAAFLGNELPDPTPAGTQYPVGYPVTLQLPASSRLTVTAGRLLGPDGNEVPSYVLDPSDKVGPNEWSLLAKQPLTPGAAYTAEVIGHLDGASYSKRWSFRVAAA